MAQPEIVEQIRNAVALVTGMLDDGMPDVGEVGLDEVLGFVIEEMGAATGEHVITAFAAIVVEVLNRFAVETGQPRDELWRETAGRLAARVTG